MSVYCLSFCPSVSNLVSPSSFLLQYTFLITPYASDGAMRTMRLFLEYTHFLSLGVRLFEKVFFKFPSVLLCFRFCLEENRQSFFPSTVRAPCTVLLCTIFITCSSTLWRDGQPLACKNVDVLEIFTTYRKREAKPNPEEKRKAALPADFPRGWARFQEG